MKLHTAELKQKELTVTQERETLERLREELDREKDRISSTALRLKTRAQEVEAFSKVNSHHADPYMCSELCVISDHAALFAARCREA